MDHIFSPRVSAFYRKLLFLLIGIGLFWAQSGKAQIYVSDDGPSQVGEYTTGGGSINPSLITSVNGPSEIAISGSTLYVANSASASVGAFNAVTGATINSSFVSGLNTPNGVAIIGNVLYVADIGTGIISTYDATTGDSINPNFITGLNSPNFITVSGSYLYITDYTSTGTVGVYNASTGAVVNASLITGLDAPGSTVVTGSTVFVVVQGSNTVAEYSAVTGTSINPTFISGLDHPVMVAMSGSDLYVTNQYSASVGQYNASTGAAINTSFITGVGYCNGICILAAVTATSSPVNGGVVSGTGAYPINSSATLTATANAGYALANWTVNGTVVSTSSNYTFTVTGDTALVANFVVNSANLNVIADPTSGGIVSGSGNYTIGSSAQISATANIGWAFTGWSDGVTTNPRTVPVPSGGAIYVANFVQQIATISVLADPAGGGAVSGSGSFLIGSSVQISATANTGWTFTGWSDGVTTNPRTVPVPAGGAVYVANFAQQVAAISVIADPSGAGTTSGSGIYAIGSSQQISATASSDWMFSGWSDGVTTNPRNVTVTSGGAAYAANFTPLTATLSVTADPTGGGTVSGGGVFPVNSSEQISATASSNWTFTGWNDGVTTNPRTVLLPAGGATYAANFTQQTALVNLIASPSNGGSVGGGGTFAVGSSVQISATANAGWTFTGWSDSATSNPRTVIVIAGGATYTADFAVAPDGPVNLTPGNLATNVSQVASFEATPFSDANTSVTQAASEWVVNRALDNSMVADITENQTDLNFLPGVSLTGSTAYLWQVRYKDNTGLWGPYSAQTLFTTGAHIYRPDALIGFSLNSLIGGGVYTSDGEGEILATDATRAHSKTALIYVKNNGNTTDGFVFHGNAGTNQFTVHYFDGTANVTKGVTAGTYKVRGVHAGGKHTIRVVVTPRSTATIAEQFSVSVTVWSLSDPSSLDTVEYVVTAQ